MAKYRSKPAEIEAMQWLDEGGIATTISDHAVDLYKWLGNDTTSQCKMGRRSGDAHNTLWLWVEKSAIRCPVAYEDWIIKEPDGVGYYPCKREIFEARWEPIE